MYGLVAMEINQKFRIQIAPELSQRLRVFGFVCALLIVLIHSTPTPFWVRGNGGFRNCWGVMDFAGLPSRISFLQEASFLLDMFAKKAGGGVKSLSE